MTAREHGNSVVMQFPYWPANRTELGSILADIQQ
jgi:hypothetical protein